MARTAKSLEDSFEELEVIIRKLEDEEVSLEESFKLYQDGMKLVKKCKSELSLAFLLFRL